MKADSEWEAMVPRPGVTHCHFWKQNPDQIPNFQKITKKIGMRVVGKGSWKEREVGKF